MTEETVQERLRENFPHLVQEYGVERIGLLGSFANGTASDDSEIDVVVEFQQPIGFRFMDLVEELEQLLERKVDVPSPTESRASAWSGFGVALWKALCMSNR